MVVVKMISDLLQERGHIEDAIMVLQRLAQGRANGADAPAG